MKPLVVVAVVAACGAPAPRSTQTNHRTLVAVGVPWGDAVPTKIVAMPPDGRWWVACQARRDTDGDGKIVVDHELHGEERGDELVAYLVGPDGRETVIEAVLDHAENGRWIVVLEHGKPTLIDTATWRREALDGELPHFSIRKGRHVWSFDPSGTRLLYFRDHAPIVRDLAAGTETQLAPAWRAEWSVDGAWLQLDTLDRGDTDGDGFVHGPDLTPVEGLGTSNCGDSFRWDHALGELVPPDSDYLNIDRELESLQRADELTRTLWRVRDGVVVRGVEAAVDAETVIARDGNGALRWGPVANPARPLAPASCQGEIGSIASVARAVLVECEGTKAGTRMIWARADRTRELVVPDDDAFVLPANRSFVNIYPDDLILDMRSGEVVSRTRRHYLGWARGDDLLIVHASRRPGARWTAELRLGSRTLALASAPPMPVTYTAGPYLVHHTARVHLGTGEIAALPVAPVGVRTDGAVLVDGGLQAIDDAEREMHLGPLRWMRP